MIGRSHNGIGTTVYGKRDFHSDGSFVTTKWVIFLWIPLFPLCSMRVRRVQSTNLTTSWLASLLLAVSFGLFAFGSSANYQIYGTRRPVLRQVLYIYTFVVALIFVWRNMAINPNLVNGALLGSVLSSPFILRAIAANRTEVDGAAPPPQ